MTREEYLSALLMRLAGEIEHRIEAWADRAQVRFEAQVGEDEALQLEALEEAGRLIEGEITLLERAFPDPLAGARNRAVSLAVVWLFAAQVREIVAQAVEAARERGEEGPPDRAHEAFARYRAA